MISYKYERSQYREWFLKLQDYIENKYVGIFVEIQNEKSGLMYESYKNFHDEDFIFSATISINSKLQPRTRLYALLHEAGHVERMVEDGDKKTFFYHRLDSAPDNMKFRSRTVVEEVLAWHKAELLANRLEIPLEERPWQIEIENAIKLYSLWCAEKGERYAKENNEKKGKQAVGL